jgi:hypothetical protein
MIPDLTLEPAGLEAPAQLIFPRNRQPRVGESTAVPCPGALRVRICKAEPLSDGFTGVPVPEIRGTVLRLFLENRMSTGANFLLASGYTGQATETLALATDLFPLERIVGVPLKSYVSLNWTYYFMKAKHRN